MKNRIITGIPTVILGAFIACMPNFILPVCSYCQSMMGKCTWAAKTEFGVGILIVFLGILLAFVESGGIRQGISISLGFVGILAALTAKVLIGFCDGSCSPECSCSPLTSSLMAAFGIAVSVLSFVNAIYLGRRKNS